jgi:hypothetical protein
LGTSHLRERVSVSRRFWLRSPLVPEEFVKIRMKQAYAASALVALALGVSACTSSTTNSSSPAGPSPAASPSPSLVAPGDALTAGIAKLATASYDVRGTGGSLNSAGAVNATAKTAFLNLTTPIGSGQTLKMDNVLIGGKVYLKMDAGTANSGMHLNPKAWILIDTSKLGKDVAMPLDAADLTDPLDVDGLNQGVTSVIRVDATHYTGTIDLTQTGGVSSPDPDDLTKAGDQAKAVPFTATLDDQGRLLTFSVNGAKISKPLQFELVFSHYGAATAATQPTATNTVAASSSVYSLLNG